MPRLRQAVIAVAELDRRVEQLRSSLGLGDPFSDPAVDHFGLRNAVFAIGDEFLELVSPVREDTSAGRLLARRGGDCGYMAMLQVDDVEAARERARVREIREVFQFELDDVGEAHLHPADIGGAIVSVSEPRPAASWRWGGPGWRERAVAGSVRGVTVAVADPSGVEARWEHVAGGTIPAQFVADAQEAGIVAIELELGGETVRLDPRDLDALAA